MKMSGKQFVKKVLIASKVIAIVFLLGAWWVEWSSLRGLENVRRQMRAEGLPLTPAELQRPLPPRERNAAPVYQQLTQLLQAKPLTGEGEVLNDVKRDVPSPVNNMQQVRFALPLRQDVVSLAHQAAQKPECNFNRDYSQGYNLLFPEYRTMRTGLRVLTNESALLLFDGKPLDAIRNETPGFQMARHADSDSFLIGKLVGISLNAITLHFMERVLYTAGEQPGVPQAIQQAIARNWRTIGMADGLRGEMVLSEVTFAQLRTGTLRDEDLKPGKDEKPEAAPESAAPHPPGLVGRAMLDANELHLLQYQRACITAAKLPPRDSQAKLDALEEEACKYRFLPTRALAVMLIPLYSQARTKQAQGEAQQAVVSSAAAIMAYWQKHGNFPVTLEQAMKSVPVDPFDNQPLRYRQEGDGFVVYSVGPTGKFDGGMANRRPNSHESLFRFPMPAYYTQAPVTDAPATAKP